MSKVAEDAWKKGERLGEVTGVPTRDHWKVSIFFPFLLCLLSLARLLLFLERKKGKISLGVEALCIVWWGHNVSHFIRLLRA